MKDLAECLPVQEFRWYQGRRHYSGWYWSSTVGRLVIYESRLKPARIMLADFGQISGLISASTTRSWNTSGEADASAVMARHLLDLAVSARYQAVGHTGGLDARRDDAPPKGLDYLGPLPVRMI